MPKPKCKLIGKNGNAFNLMGLVSDALKKAGQTDKEKEFSEKAWNAESYDALLVLCGEYVDIT